MFWAVTALAFALRAAQVLLMSDPAVNPHWLRPIADAAMYDIMARGLLTGAWPTPEPFFSAPLYPFVLGGLYAVFGAGAMLPVLLVQALISSLGAGFAALAARRIWTPRVGWFAGALHAVLWTSIFFAAELLAVSLTVTLLLLALWLVLRADPSTRLGYLWAGLALGLACLARPNLLVLLPVWLWFVVRHRDVGWRTPRWAMLAVGVAVVILPATLHNLVRGGTPALITSSGGVNFYIGNNPDADGASVSLPDIPPSREDMAQNLTRAAEQQTGRLMRPAEVDRHFLGKGLSFWAQHPGEALSLQVRKLGLVVGMHERSNTKHLYFWRDRSPLLKWPVWLGFTPLLLLGILGFWRRDLDPGSRFLLLGSAVAFALTLALFFVNGRFRLPLVALLVIPAAGGLDWLWMAWRQHRWALPRPAVAVLLTAALVSVTPDLLAYHPRAGLGDPAVWYSLGQSYQAIGDESRAVTAYRRALAQQRAKPQPHFELIAEPLYTSLGDLLTRTGRVAEAQQLYAGWARANPRDVEPRVRLGDTLLQTGNIDGATEQFAAVLRMDPDNPQARLGMAWSDLYRGHAERAHAAFEEIHRSDPNAHALFGAGLALMQSQRLDEAVRAFREVLVLDPGYWQAWGNLADIHDRQGRLDEAAEAFRNVLQANPADQAARQWLRQHQRESAAGR